MSDKSLGRPPHSSVVLNIKLESPRVLFSSARLSVSLQSPVASLYTFRQGWQWSLTPPQIQEWTGSQAVPWPRCPWTSSVSLLCVDAVWSSDCWVSYTTDPEAPSDKGGDCWQRCLCLSKANDFRKQPTFQVVWQLLWTVSHGLEMIHSPILLLITSNQKCCTFIILHLTECLFYNIWVKKII